MKTLNVPFIENLENMSADALGSVLTAEGAHDTIESVAWDEYPYRPEVSFDIAASNTYLFVQYHVKSLGLKAEFGKTNEPVWQDSCVELFIGDRDGVGYRNFEVNCIGTLLSAHQNSRGVDVVPVTDREADSVIRYPSLPHETFLEKDGEHLWSLILGVPFALLGYENRPESLRANLYKCADGSRWMHYVSWSPIDTPHPDFHRPDFFGKLIIEPQKLK